MKFEKGRFGDLRYFVTDYSNFNHATGWKPKMMPKEGITKLIEWVKGNEKLFYERSKDKFHEPSSGYCWFASLIAFISISVNGSVRLVSTFGFL